MTSRTRAVATIALSAALATAGIALGGAAHAADPVKVNVVLSEWIVKPKPKTVKTGKVQFVAKDLGTQTHEFVVVRGSDPAAALPTAADGSVDEDQIPEDDVIGEIEDIEPQKSGKVTFKLKPGKYILFCNIVDEEADGQTEVHFAEGMSNTITVTK